MYFLFFDFVVVIDVDEIEFFFEVFGYVDDSVV